METKKFYEKLDDMFKPDNEIHEIIYTGYYNSLWREALGQAEEGIKVTYVPQLVGLSLRGDQITEEIQTPYGKLGVVITQGKIND